MRRALLAGVAVMLGMMSGRASGQLVIRETIRGVQFHDTCRLTDDRINTAGVTMTWHASEGGNYYEGSGNGMTYRLDRSGPYGEWAITLIVPRITCNGAVVQSGPDNTIPMQFRSMIPSPGPMYEAYGIDANTGVVYLPDGEAIVPDRTIRIEITQE